MLDATVVVDAVAHGYHFTPENRIAGALSDGVAAMVYGGHVTFAPGDRRFVLDAERFMDAADPQFLAHALFAESQVDACIYHEVPTFGMFTDGGSPLWVGRAMRERWPERVALYGGLSPWQPAALDRIDQLVEEDGVVGLKLYPLDLVDGELRPVRLDDAETLFPVLERARQRGIRTIAVHKAIPLGPVRLEPFRADDVDTAAAAFPDLTFEVVHGGFAFVEETALQLARFPNVAVTLEGTSAYLATAPRRFAEIIGAFLSVGAADRIVWATGCMAFHPRPLLEAFWDLQMPPDLVEGYGYPELTAQVKRGILGSNAMRITGVSFDPGAVHDEFTDRAELAPPWSGELVRR